MGRFPTCGTDAPQIKQSPRPSPGNPVSRCIFFFFISVRFHTFWGRFPPHRLFSSHRSGAFPPETARHTPLHNRCPVFSGATISGSKPQTQVWDPTRSHLLVSTARTEAHFPARVTCLKPQSPLCGPHSRVLLPPAPRANLSLASWGSRHNPMRRGAPAVRIFAPLGWPLTPSPPPPPLASVPLDAAIPDGHTGHNSRCSLAVT